MNISGVRETGMAIIAGGAEGRAPRPEGRRVPEGVEERCEPFHARGPLRRKVVEALRRENRKYGRLRVTILPPMPGLTGERESEE
jgi:hypothetical protein